MGASSRNEPCFFGRYCRRLRKSCASGSGGYLLAINKAVGRLAPGTPARLLISYPPCGEDVVHWCRERGIEYLGTSSESGLWTVRIRK